MRLGGAIEATVPEYVGKNNFHFEVSLLLFAVK